MKTILGTLLSLFFIINLINAADTNLDDRKVEFGKVIDNHLMSVKKCPNTWWMTHYTPTQSEQLEEESLHLNIESILEVMKEFRCVNNTTLTIYPRITNATWSVYLGVISNFCQLNVVKGGYAPIIVLIPQNFKDLKFSMRSNTLSLFNSDKKNGIVFIPAMNLTETLMASMYYHEIGHLLQGEKMNEDIAEIEMTSLSIQICYHGKPEYKKQIEKIVSRSKFKSCEDLIFSVTEKDLAELDGNLVDSNFASKRLSAYLLNQHLLAIAFAYDDRNGHDGNLRNKYEMLQFIKTL